MKTSDWELGAHERSLSSGTLVEYVQVVVVLVAMFMTTTEAGALVSAVHVRYARKAPLGLTTGVCPSAT